MNLCTVNKPYTINFIKSDYDVKMRKGSKWSAGYDIQSQETVLIAPHHRVLVDSGLRLEEPTHNDIYLRIAPRSSLSLKGIDIGAGCVDPDYTGAIKILLCNNSPNEYTVNKGDFVAQIILEKKNDFYSVALGETPVISYKTREENGFGSSDLSPTI
jgi:dUTP pyrophosphatase